MVFIWFPWYCIPILLHKFSCGIPKYSYAFHMLLLICFYGIPMVFLQYLNVFLRFSQICLWFSNGIPRVFLWFSHEVLRRRFLYYSSRELSHFPMIVLRLSYNLHNCFNGFPMICIPFLSCCYAFL